MSAKHLSKSLVKASTRVPFFDVVRGFSVLSMMGFHFCYDLKYIAGVFLPWFEPPIQDIWRASISWVFVFIAGCMFAWSRNNLKRAGKYLACALLIFFITSIVAVDTPISFGIIYCMGSCTLVAFLLDRLHIRPKGILAACLFFITFLCLLELPHGRIGFTPYTIDLPSIAYETPWLSWLGLPGPKFVSGDYYPLLPYLMLYLSGSAAGRFLRSHGLPRIIRHVACAPLEYVGKAALPLYIAHQPILLGIVGILVPGSVW